MRALPILFAACLLILPAAAVQEGDDGPVVSLDPGVSADLRMDEIYQGFARGYRMLDAAQVADQYTEEALYLAPGEEIQQGRAAIREGFERMFEQARQRGQRLRIQFRILHRETEGRFGYDVGVFTLTRYASGREVGRGRGRFTVVARPEADGIWRFALDTYSDLPAQEDPPQASE